MLKVARTAVPAKRNLNRERSLWHDSKRQTIPLGCAKCPELELCDGLQIAANAFDCLSFCCGKPDECQKVCRNNPAYPDRKREIRGFDLANVPSLKRVPGPSLPVVVPLIFHGKSRNERIAPAAVALPLYRMFNLRDGNLRYSRREELCRDFGVSIESQIILSGTATDPPLEKWWALGSERRQLIIKTMRNIGIALVTTPNYSLFLDVPRWDDLHSMKRIALVHQEFTDGGLPTALHVNGRTDADFRRWAEYICARPQITHLAYEFATGTGWAGRRERHAEWLISLANAVKRPLHLVIRGGTDVMSRLQRAYDNLSLVETSIFMKTIKRRRAIPTSSSRLTWLMCPTATGTPLDELMQANLKTVERWLQAKMAAKEDHNESQAA